MGQKIHPVGLRLGITRTWESRWFEKKNYKAWLHEDQAVRKYFGRLTRAAAISKVEIERRANQARIVVHTAKPGIIIGKRGVGIEDIRKNLEHLTQKNVQVNVVEIKHPELDARLVGQNIVDQLEKRIAFRRAMKQAIMRTMKAGAKGVKVMVSGRLGGAEIARTEQNHDGKVPLHTLRADIDYAHVEAFTQFGRIGCKVWIYKGEVMPETPRPQERPSGPRPEGEKATFRDRRSERRGGRSRSGSGTSRSAEVDNEIDDFDFPTSAEIEHDHSSTASTIDGAFAIPDHPRSTGEHGGAAVHDRAAQHGHGVTAETSQVDPASQHTEDSAERPGGPSAAAHVAPEPVAHVAPEPVAHVAPEPVAHVAPEPVADAAPEPVAPVAPEPGSPGSGMVGGHAAPTSSGAVGGHAAPTSSGAVGGHAAPTSEESE
jgi:small subunit ribosomal protein S3